MQKTKSKDSSKAKSVKHSDDKKEFHTADINNERTEGILEKHDQIARAFGVSIRTVTNWARDGMPKMRDGRYSIPDIQAWRFTKNNKRSQEQNFGADWEDKYRQYKALKEEISYKKEMGQLFAKEEIEKGLIELFTTIKTLMLGMPRAVSPQLQGLEARQIESILSSRIKEIITMISTEKIFTGSKSNNDKGSGKHKKT